MKLYLKSHKLSQLIKVFEMSFKMSSEMSLETSFKTRYIPYFVGGCDVIPPSANHHSVKDRHTEHYNLVLYEMSGHEISCIEILYIMSRNIFVLNCHVIKCQVLKCHDMTFVNSFINCCIGVILLSTLHFIVDVDVLTWYLVFDT